MTHNLVTTDADTETMRRNIGRMDDETLTRELSFAEGFDDDMPAAVTWLYLLRVAAKNRAATEGAPR